MNPVNIGWFSLLLLFVLPAGLAACGDDDDDLGGGDGDADADSDADTDADSDADADADVDADADADGDANFECTGDGTETDVSAEIASDQTWLCGNTYFLTDLIFVTSGTTLTIEPGATIKGDPLSALIMTRGSHLVADGLPDHPIVFTSASEPGSRLRGDWGGLVLLGDADVNVPEGHVEGIADDDARGGYGGDDDTSNCGTLRYVRVEFAGYAISADNELNGITVAGCGTDTVLDYIQVHMGNDDGIEFFGGTASASHVVISRPQDDSLDWDQGWRGSLQFAIVQQDTDGVAGDKGFENDNLNGDNDVAPRTSPRIYNVTMIGSGNVDGTQGGAHIRRGAAGEYANIILMDFPAFGVNISDPSTSAQWGDGLSWMNGMFFDSGVDGAYFLTDADDGDFDETAEFSDDAMSNVFDVDPMLGDPHDLAAPDFVPAAGSPAASGGATPPEGLDTSATWIGAIEPGGTDWTAGWTAYPAN